MDRLPPDAPAAAASDQPRAEPPPILGSWKRLYTTVLLLHLVFLIGFYLFTRYYA